MTKKAIAAFVGLAVMVILIVAVSRIKPVQRLTGMWGSVDRAINLLERVEGMVEVNTDMLNEMPAKWEALEKGVIARQRAEIERLSAQGERYRQQADHWQRVAQEAAEAVPPPSNITPVDLSECLTELQKSRERGEGLQVVIAAQTQQITNLKLDIAAQKGIITAQGEIILQQGAHITEIHDTFKDIQSEASRTAFIGVVTGTAAGVLCVAVSVPAGVGVAVAGAAYIIIKK